jgi:hypothetical protein
VLAYTWCKQLNYDLVQQAATETPDISQDQPDIAEGMCDSLGSEGDQVSRSGANTNIMSCMFSIQMHLISLIHIVETNYYMFKPYDCIVLPQVLAEGLREAFGDPADPDQGTGEAASGCINHLATAASRSLDPLDTDSIPAGQGTPPLRRHDSDESAESWSEPACIM